MQTAKKRSGSSEGFHRWSPVTPQSACKTRVSRSETGSPSTPSARKTPTDQSPKAINHSPRGPASENKQVIRVIEKECQLTQLLVDLKRTKDQLASSESQKRQAEQEAEEAKKQFLAMREKLESSQHQLLETPASEDKCVQKPRKLSLEQDRALQSELQAIQKQRSVDLAALFSAMDEIQRLKVQLEMVIKSEAAQTKQAEVAEGELQGLKQEMVKRQSLIESLKSQLSECEKTEAEYQELLVEAQMQLEMANTAAYTLRSDGMKVVESFSQVCSELEESKARVSSLEENVRALQSQYHLNNDSSALLDSVGNEIHLSQNSEYETFQSEIEQLKSSLEGTEQRYHEVQIQSVMQIQSAYGAVEHIKIESRMRESELELALREMRTEIVKLKECLIDRETGLHSISDSNERLTAEVEKCQETQEVLDVDLLVQKSIEDLAIMKAKFINKEMALQSISDENELLKLQVERREAETEQCNKLAMAEVEVAMAAEQDALMRLGFVTKEADKNSRRAARVGEQLEAAQATNSEMEAELRRLRVQTDQWRKAAEAAVAILTTGSNGKLMDRSGSSVSEYPGKSMGSLYADDFDDDTPKKKNNNVLRKMVVLWKKGQK